MMCARPGCKNKVGPRHRRFCSGDCSARWHGSRLARRRSVARPAVTPAISEAAEWFGYGPDELIDYVYMLEAQALGKVSG